MCKKILFILGMVLFVSLKITNLYAETIQIIPPQKPTLSSEEIIKKISKNIITPLKKPTKIKKVEKKVVVKEVKEKKLSFKIPKKKQSVTVVTITKNIKISCIFCIDVNVAAINFLNRFKFIFIWNSFIINKIYLS